LLFKAVAAAFYFQPKAGVMPDGSGKTLADLLEYRELLLWRSGVVSSELAGLIREIEEYLRTQELQHQQDTADPAYLLRQPAAPDGCGNFSHRRNT
jgi:hypothetical protein